MSSQLISAEDLRDIDPAVRVEEGEVIVAGAWANQLVEPLEIDLGVYPRMSRIAVLRWS